MRLIKANTGKYDSFHKSLKTISGLESSKIFSNSDSGNSNENHKYYYVFQNLKNFENLVSSAQDYETLTDALSRGLKRLIPLKELTIFLLDSKNYKLDPITDTYSSLVYKTTNDYYSQGVFDIIFESKNTILLPPLDRVGEKINFLVFPLINAEKRIGVLVISTSATKINEHSTEFISAQMLINISTTKIENLKLKNSLKENHSELQTYQAKIQNDYKLSALGELTDGVMTDINDALQIITSYSDFMKTEDSNNYHIDKINTQVFRIKELITQLNKFSNINIVPSKLESTSVNKLIEEFFSLSKSTLTTLNIESLLDLEKNIPPILTHTNLFNQILTNYFGLLKESSRDGGGVLVQTRYQDETIIIKILATTYIEVFSTYSSQELDNVNNTNLRMIVNFVKKNEGTVKVTANAKSGSTMLIELPLKRRVRE
ncbi:MAG: hypothetical protein C0425_02085 [Chlorobiaceae bacterium]|nr:hypothetical protein [Chlorobiaceae bacterium]MBA4309108.1 hypothetical protein [Chlorobiaceae bacterium]